MNGIGIEMCVNEGGNYEQTLINTEKLCARLLPFQYDLNPAKALKKHQDFHGKRSAPSTLISEGRWDEFCSRRQPQKYTELKAAEAAEASSIRLAQRNRVAKNRGKSKGDLS